MVEWRNHSPHSESRQDGWLDVLHVHVWAAAADEAWLFGVIRPRLRPIRQPVSASLALAISFPPPTAC
jgi:hypothetical protein